MLTMTTTYMTYEQASVAFDVGVRKLQQLVTAGIITRHTQARDGRRVVLNPQELKAHFNDNTPTKKDAA